MYIYIYIYTYVNAGKRFKRGDDKTIFKSIESVALSANLFFSWRINDNDNLAREEEKEKGRRKGGEQ